jgi:hypothetical protein
MTQIRPNVFLVTHAELGKPLVKGLYEVEGLGTVGLDEADVRYIREHIEKGFEPVFFVSHAPTMGGRLVVVSRQRAA